MKLSRVLVGSALFACAGMAQAAVVQTKNVDITSQTFYPVSSTDLINQGQSTLASQSDSGYTQYSTAGAATVLNDGSVGTSDVMSTTLFEFGDAAYSFTYNLNTAVNTAGYDISSLATYTGWKSSFDYNRVGVNFTVSYTKVGGGSGTIGTFVNDPINYTSTNENVSSQTLVTLSDGDVVTGVNSLTFAFVSPAVHVLTTKDVSPMLREIDAFGTPTSVPEPTAFSLLGLTSLALMRRRRA